MPRHLRWRGPQANTHTIRTTIMPRVRVTERLLEEVQSWAVQRLTTDEYSLIEILINELRRLRQLVARDHARQLPKTRKPTRSLANAEIGQCVFMRTIGDLRFQCAAK